VNLEILEMVDIGGESPGGGVTRRPVDGESLTLGSDDLGVVGRKASSGNLVGRETGLGVCGHRKEVSFQRRSAERLPPSVMNTYRCRWLLASSSWYLER
jgi:hypothetical protein